MMLQGQAFSKIAAISRQNYAKDSFVLKMKKVVD